MHEFVREHLWKRLEELDAVQRVAFAAACATRLLPSCDILTEVGGPGLSGARRALDDVWQRALGAGSGDLPLQAHEKACEASLDWVVAREQDEGGRATECQGALLALLRAVRAARSGSATDASWAASHAFDAAYDEAWEQQPEVGRLPDMHVQLMSSDVVQRELARQDRDLLQIAQTPLEDQSIRELVENLRKRAENEPLMSPDRGN